MSRSERYSASIKIVDMRDDITAKITHTMFQVIVIDRTGRDLVRDKFFHMNELNAAQNYQWKCEGVPACPLEQRFHCLPHGW